MTYSFPPIEYEESYPIDEDFGAFDGLPLDFVKAAAWLWEELPQAAENMPCACWIEDGEGVTGRAVKLIHFSTYGWSGAESIIGLIERRFDMRHFMLSWKRGGHYVFELPAQGMSAGTAETGTGSGLQPASPVGNADAPKEDCLRRGMEIERESLK